MKEYIVAQYLQMRCETQGIRRGAIPQLLGYSNSNKALRRYDAFLAGAFDDAEMLSRLRSCSQLVGDGFEQALAESIAEQKLDSRESTSVVIGRLIDEYYHRDRKGYRPMRDRILFKDWDWYHKLPDSIDRTVGTSSNRELFWVFMIVWVCLSIGSCGAASS